MGTEHAHYVIVDAGGHRVWSRRGGAGTFYGDLLRGPDRLAAFVREQEHGHALGWGDAVRWQAVAVLDVSRRLLLVHCSLEIRGPVWRTSVPEIRERATPFAALEAVPWNGVHLDAAARTLDWWSLDCSLPRRGRPSAGPAGG
ncbi:hypothetical protein ACIBK9_07755 [Nonomuraea sp. NPDC050227]|uniref:hypothetical protein n=1 Tax=Nonomuraea sp. NPDC050227 TaxID=3364360 RepID=UPI0037AD2909